MAARRDFVKPAAALAVGAAAALVVLGLSFTAAGRLIEAKTRDARMEWSLPSRDCAHPDVAFIVVTEESIKWIEEEQKVSWPWGRDVFGYLFQACARGPAQCVLFDFFTLVDRGEGEPELVEALKVSPPAYLATPFKVDPVPTADARPDLRTLLERYAIEVDSDGSAQVDEPYLSVLLPRPGIAEAVAGVCDVSTPRDQDGVVRRYRLFSRFRGRYYPSFALAALMVHEKVRRVEVRHRILHVGKVSIPMNPDGTLCIRYYRPQDSFRLLVASRVIGGWAELEEKGKVTTFDPKDVQGKVVIIGTNAAALYDRPTTPVAKLMPGFEIHAMVIANALNGEYLKAAPVAVSILLTALLGMLAAVVTRYLSAVWGGVLAAVLLIGYGVSNAALFRWGWIVELTAPLGSAGAAYAAVSALNFLTEGRQRRRTRREFARYLSPKVVDKILLNPDGLRMEGERKVLTIFFMDFAGFTSMSETLDPTELVRLVSQYHNEAAEEIFRTEGTIDKYIGDAIMAFWNDPIDQPDHAVRACLTAVGAQKRLREFAARMREQGLPEMHARMGINTGIATVGNFGAKGQVNYTVMGDEVNLASRLEGVNKEFGTDIIASEATYAPAREKVEARELALIKVKGKKHPVRIFELLGPRGEVDPGHVEAARAFERGLEAFRARRFEEAGEIFRPLSAAGDRAARAHLELCERYRKEPPPPDWDGSYQMLTK